MTDLMPAWPQILIIWPFIEKVPTLAFDDQGRPLREGEI